MYLGKIISIIISLELISRYSIRVYSILNFNKYSLFNSILFDNYRAIHLVNNRNLLELGSFRKANPREVVKYSSLSLLITGYSSYILKNYLNRLNRLELKDLVLSKVILIKGFYINIILEALLIEKSI